MTRSSAKTGLEALVLLAKSLLFTGKLPCPPDTIAVRASSNSLYVSPLAHEYPHASSFDRSHVSAAFGGPAGRQTGSHTPRGLNSLTAIAGHEGDEDEWNVRYQNEDEVRHPTLEPSIVLSDVLSCSIPACLSPITVTESPTPLPLHRPCLPTTLAVSHTSPLPRLVRRVQAVFAVTRVSTIPTPTPASGVLRQV